ncbi:MAG: hypothetical protein AB8B86_08245 [Pseudomonadales bacterium]
MSHDSQPSRPLSQMSTLGSVHFALAFSLVLPVPALADTINELKNCARTQENTVRAACYEELGARVLRQDAQGSPSASAKNQGGGEEQASNVDMSPTPALSPTPSPATVKERTAPQAMPDDLGKTRSDSDKVEEYYAHVSSCQQAHDKQWFYIFENGQVWKQVDRRRRHYKECDFDVTLSKDAFGFVFRVNGEGPKTRIRRHR